MFDSFQRVIFKYLTNKIEKTLNFCMFFLMNILSFKTSFGWITLSDRE